LVGPALDGDICHGVPKLRTYIAAVIYGLFEARESAVVLANCVKTILNCFQTCLQQVETDIAKLARCHHLAH
jgi:translation initiation factor 2B subunit (eIF-2B alpha/beta/delta family)